LFRKWLLAFKMTAVPSSSRSSTHDPAELQELLPFDTMSIPEDEPYPHWFSNSFFNYCKVGIYLKY
jgi:hypothetical protein